MSLPSSAKYAIVGAGIHGLSTALHLAERLKATGRGSGADILIVDKTAIAAGASGIACGVVRNNYYQPAMRELMAHSVDVWESDPKAYSYHPVGYMQISPEVMHEQVGTIYEQQKAIGYDSVFIEGAADSQKYMTGLFDDWQAKGITSVLHEKRGGYANNTASMYGLATKAEAEGVRILTGVEVLGFEFGSNSGAVTALITNRGNIACDHVIIGAAHGCRGSGRCSICRSASPSRAATARSTRAYRCGPIGVSRKALWRRPKIHKTNDGRMPPVIHVDTDARLYSDVDGSLTTSKLWGCITNPTSISAACRAAHRLTKLIKTPTASRSIPTVPTSPDFVVGDDFIHMWCSMLAHCQKWFEGKTRYTSTTRIRAGSAVHARHFPVFDTFRNVYVIANSNHGYKMIGVGKLVAQEPLGEKSTLLEPFRFARFAKGELHPTSHSPFPWS